MVDEDHYYVEGYSADSDPYALANGVLKNNFDLKDFASLNEIEADIAGIEIQAILQQVPPTEFNTAQLRHLHTLIFHQVYPWAGELRKVDVAKGHTHFMPHQEMGAALAAIFLDLAERDFLKTATADVFCQVIGAFLVRLNFIHPFREGNGRVQRLLVSQIASNAGFFLDWQSVGNDAMKQACIEGISGNTRPMVRLLRMNLKE